LQVRVNDRGPFVDGRIIDLSHEAARELGYDRRGLARVRVRYVGPAQPPFGDVGRRYAPNELKSPNLPAPDVAPAPLELAQAEPMSEAPVATAPSEVESAPAEVQVEVQVPAAAPPPAPSELSPGDLRGASPPAAVAAPAMGYRIQVGAFSDPVNARRAVRLLAPVTQAMIEPVARPGGILYRVLAVGPVGQAEALVLRDRLAQMGFPDARVVPPAGH
jgi:rare lipoprotein A